MKLNLCSGYDKLEGYINVDKVYGHNLLDPLPFGDNSVEIISVSHGLNYFSYTECRFVVSEIYRVLLPEGVVRASLPDLRKWAKYYLENDTEFLFQKHGGKDRFTGVTSGDKFIGQVYHYGAKYFFDFESLKVLFEDVGFTTIENRNYLDSRILEVKLLDTRPELSFYIEAVKHG